MSIKKNEVRQSSVIYNLGPGGLSVLQDGSVVIIPGIDAWYIDRARNFQDIPEDICIQDKNLSKELKVDIFVPPPAENISADGDFSTLPVMLFPKWVTCYDCNHVELVEETATRRPICPNCNSKFGKKKKLIQVNFVVACDAGHLDEFPWVEWVHGGHENICGTPAITFYAKSAVQLSDQIISCTCGAKKNMAGTTDPETFSKGLTGEPNSYSCTARRPWLRDRDSNPCIARPRMVLRNSNNLYYSSISTSILIPTQGEAPANVLNLVRNHPNSPRYKARYVRWKDFDKLTASVIAEDPDYYEQCSKEDVRQALVDLIEVPEQTEEKQNSPELEFIARDSEWKALQTEQEDVDLVVRKHQTPGEKLTERTILSCFAVPKLKVTTCLKGFSRIEPSNIELAQGKSQLRRNPFAKNANWLPAVQHTGEGIFVLFDEEHISNWEKQPAVIERVNVIQKNLNSLGKKLTGVELSPRFVLLHTISHLLIQELVLECGYTSASLCERIYAKPDQAGILIYTASSDADGTMGGLVEMSRPDRLSAALERAISKANWCSNDPVCMESGTVGQGNFGSNLAACHGCTLLPETACEFFNQGLDRGLLIGDLTEIFPKINFFNPNKV